MPREIVIKRGALISALLIVAGLGLLALVQNIPEIRREIRIWMM